MRILHVIGSLDPATGGPPMIAASLAAGQASLGHDVGIATMEDPRRCNVAAAALSKVPGYASVAVHAIDTPGGLKTFLGLSLRRKLKRLVAETDVVHLHGIWDPLLLATAAACRRQRRAYFVLLNGMLDPWSLRQKPLKKRIALALAYRRMLDGAAALHLGNADEQRLIEPLRLRSPGVIIPNGIFFEEIDPLPEPGRFRAAHPELGDRPYLLFMGRLHYKKGLDILIDAFASFAESGGSMDLVVAGPDEGAREEFEHRVHEHNLEDRVHVIGPIYGSQKIEALRDATVFILPSRQEGFSVAITEALAVGLPVIITDNCHFPEVAEAGAGLVTHLDPEQVAEAITRLAHDPAEAASMGRAARRLVESHYTWPKIAQQLVDVYERFAGGRKAG